MEKTTASAPPAAIEKIVYVYPSQLQERRANNRFQMGNMVELRNSISTHGVKQPLRVRKTKLKTEDDGSPIYEVLVGNRRAKACKEIGSSLAEESAFVPVVIVPANITEEEIIIESITTDAHGLGRTQIEIAYDVNALNLAGWKGKDIAPAINKSTQYVSDCLKFMQEANEDLIKKVKGGLVTFNAALDMIKAGQTGAQVAETVDKVVKKKEAKGGDEIINPDKNANVVNKVKKSELQEESGIDKKVSKSAPATSVKAAGSDAPKVVKEDETLIQLKNLLTQIRSNTTANRRGLSRELLGAIIGFIEGKHTMLELMPAFFWGFDEEFDTVAKRVVLRTDLKEKPVVVEVPVAVKPAKAAKAPEPDLDDLDSIDDIPEAKPAKAAKKAPAAPAKPTKGAQSLGDKKKAAKGKKKPADDDDDEDAYAEEVEVDSDFDDELE